MKKYNLIEKDKLVEIYESRVSHLDKFNALRVTEPDFFYSVRYHTDTLPEKYSIRARMWHIINGDNPPLCQHCGLNETKWSEDDRAYRPFCSPACSCKSAAAKEARANSMIEKYGVDNISKLSDTVDRRRETNLKKYGHIHACKSEKTKRKARETCMERYGVDHHIKVDHIRDKLRKPKPIHILDPTHLQFCNHDMKMNFQDIGKDLNVSGSTIVRNFDKFDIQKIYHTRSSEEKEIAEFIKSLGFDCVENSRKIISPKELDIFIPEKNIAIEHCGLYWHSEINKDKHYHADKFNACADKNIRLFTIFQNEWRHRKEIVKQKLRIKLNKDDTKPIYARKCITVTETEMASIKKFYDDNHIQGFARATHHLALISNNEMVAMMSMKEASSGNFELVRYASNAKVVGGFTKLLVYFERQFNPSAVKTFADLRWDDGRMYKTSGFIMDKLLPPDYSYIIGDTLVHKFNMRHASLKKFEKYDATLSEHENCLNMGIFRIYDCGKLRFVKTYK